MKEQVFTHQEAVEIIKKLIETQPLKLIGADDIDLDSEDGAWMDARYLKQLLTQLTTASDEYDEQSETDDDPAPF